MRKLNFIFFLMLAFSCKKEKVFDGPDYYSDGFESYNSIDSIIDGDNEKWSFFQLTYEGNNVSIDSLITHSGNRSVKSEAKAANNENGASKASINKQFMAFFEGETVQVDFWIYIVGEAEANWMFIFDLEEKVPIGAGPGMRLALVENELTLEHKFPNPNVHQNEEDAVKMPRDQWVHIRFETLLSRKKKGYVKVYQDDVLVIETKNWKTLPSDILYFQQGTKGMYDQIEFGITANSQDNDMIMYVDDIEVQVIN